MGSVHTPVAARGTQGSGGALGSLRTVESGLKGSLSGQGSMKDLGVRLGQKIRLRSQTGQKKGSSGVKVKSDHSWGQQDRGQIQVH